MTDRQSTHSHDCCDCGPKHYEYEVWQDGVLQAGGSTTDYASAKSEASHYAAMYTPDGPVEVRIYEKRLLGATQQPAAAPPQPKRCPYNASGSLSEYGVSPECDAQQPAVLERDWLADDHAHICSKLAEQYKSDPVLFAALTDAAAIIRDLMRELRRETERRWEGNRRAAQEYVDDMRDVLKEAARVCKDLDDEALAKENRLACGAECAAAIADLAARMNVHCEVNHE